MVNDFNSWKQVIENYIDERKNRKLIELLKKKESSRSDYDAKQCIKTQILYNLKNSNNKIDKTKVSDIEKRKNIGKHKTDELSFIKQVCDDLLDLFPINSIEGNEIKSIYETRYNAIVELHEPSNWLNTYVSDAKGILPATHVPKITHSSISSKTTAFSISKTTLAKPLLTTDNLNQLEYDFFRTTAAYDRTVNLLKLSFQGEMLLNCIQRKDITPFLSIANKKDDATRWMDELYEVFSIKSLGSHALQKQIYFPVNHNFSQYHLLCIVPSSSIIHLMYNKFNERYQKKITTFSSEERKVLPSKSKAVLYATSSKDAHRNVSPLNIERQGKVCLLSTQPPVWKSQSNYHLKQESIFDGKALSYRISDTLSYLAEYLLRFQGINISVSAPEKKKWLKRWVYDIWKDIFSYTNEIVFSHSANWTKKEKHNFKLRYQFLLDPYCTDVDFQDKRETLKWQDDIALDFSRWLTRCLKYEAESQNKTFTNSNWYQDLWFDYACDELREHEIDIQKLCYDFGQESI